MQFYHRLKLTGTPLKESAVEELYQRKIREMSGAFSYNTLHQDVENFLKQELLESLMLIGLKPIFFVHFGSVNNKVTQTILHSDVTKHNGQWVKDSAAINWDLTPGTCNFAWYDTHDLEQFYPKELPHKNVLYEIHNGVHYGQRMAKDTSQCSKLYELSMQRNTAYLVRTDIPHQITYSCSAPIRLGISLRFSVANIESWQSAEQKFASLIDL